MKTTAGNERKQCTTCGGFFLVRRDGKIREHKQPGSWAYATCSGSGKMPKTAEVAPTPAAPVVRERKVVRLTGDGLAAMRREMRELRSF